MRHFLSNVAACVVAVGIWVLIALAAVYGGWL